MWELLPCRQWCHMFYVLCILQEEISLGEPGGGPLVVQDTMLVGSHAGWLGVC